MRGHKPCLQNVAGFCEAGVYRRALLGGRLPHRSRLLLFRSDFPSNELNCRTVHPHDAVRPAPDGVAAVGRERAAARVAHRQNRPAAILCTRLQVP